MGSTKRSGARARRLAAIATAASVLLTASPTVASAADLVDFGDCGQMLRFVRAGASSDEETYPSWVNGSQDAYLNARSVWSKDRFDDSAYATGDGYGSDTNVVQETADSAVAAGKADGDDPSGTNVQEQGVDEPDVVKADRNYLYVMAGSRLRIYKIKPAVPQLVAQLRLPVAEGRLLRSGDRMLVIGARPRRELSPRLEAIDGTTGPLVPSPTPAPTTPTGTTPSSTTPTVPTTPANTSPATGSRSALAATTPAGTSPTTPTGTTPAETTPAGTSPLTPILGTTPGDPWPVPTKESDDQPSARYPYTTRLLEISLEDPEAPVLQRTLDAPGMPLTARQVGSTVRLVIDSSTDPDEEEDDDVTLDELRPYTRMESEVTGDVYRRPEAPCFDTARPTDGYSGAQLLAILTFDLDRGIVAPQRLGVMATPQTVYASTKTLYVASSVEHERSTTAGWAGDSSTDIFQFDASEPGKTSYLGHGSVPGLPVNSYAFSESAAGDLRIATSTYAWWETDTPESDDGCDTDDCDSIDVESSDWGDDADTRMTVLRRDGEDLREIGVRAGLDKGEQVSAVRYDGDRAYVASSGASDPLRILDLSDPAAPKALGELRLPGESTYLHPLGDDLLLSVGRDRSKDDDDVYGSRVSLYDVADPARPKRLAARRLGPGWTPTDYDTHAFLWWPKRHLAFVPYAGYGYWADDDNDPSALVVLRAARDDDGPNLTERGRVTHGPDWDHPGVNRAVVIGDRLLSISEIGISSNRLSDLGLLGTAPFYAAR